MFGRVARCHSGPLERPRPRCEYDIDTDHDETGWKGVVCLFQDRDKSLAVVNKVMNFRMLKFGIYLD